MNEVEARKFVVDGVSVRRQQIVVMKGLLLKHYDNNSATMLERAVQQVSPSKPANVVLHPTNDPVPTLRQLSEWISWWIAGCEALWGLVHSNVLLPGASNLNDFHPGIEWTTVVPGSGGRSAGWNFPEFKISYPHGLTRSHNLEVPQFLCDCDLFLRELDLPELHNEVEEALREAVSCFRAQLYTAAVVMLGKASEGTWVETGLALLSALPADEAPKREKMGQEWNGPDVGFAKKMRDIVKLYETRQDVFKQIGTSANVRLDELRMAMLWSDALRDARNVIHHNVDTNINPTFDMVSTLFLAALPNLKTLHRLTAVAKK